jgi:hypothetical protein
VAEEREEAKAVLPKRSKSLLFYFCWTIAILFGLGLLGSILFNPHTHDFIVSVFPSLRPLFPEGTLAR